MQRTDSLEKTLMLGKTEGKRKRGRKRIRYLDGITNSKHISLSKLREMVKDREACCAAVHGITKSWTWLSDWTTTITTNAGSPPLCAAQFHDPVSSLFFPSLHGKQMGKQWKQGQTLFWGAPKSLQMVNATMKLKNAFSLEAKLWPTCQGTFKESHMLFSVSQGPSVPYQFLENRNEQSCT